MSIQLEKNQKIVALTILGGLALGMMVWHDLNLVAVNAAPLTIPPAEITPFESPNWSGYALANFQSGQHYGHVAGSWKVPPVKWGSTNWNPLGWEFNAIWIGIGGWYNDPQGHTVDTNLIQIGTETSLHHDGVTQQSVWYQLYPLETTMTVIPRPIDAGDTITASITCIAHCVAANNQPQTWKLVISDISRGSWSWSWSKTVSFYTDMHSAEWIIESPYREGHLPLNNFGRATLSALMANQAPAVLTTQNAIVGNNPQGGQTSVPSVASGNSFSTCWGFGTHTPCLP